MLDQYKPGTEGFDRTLQLYLKVAQEMSLLDRCAGGLILEPAITDVVDTNLVPFADELVDNLSGPQREVYDSEARFKMLAAGRRFGKTHLSLHQLIVWGAQKAGSLIGTLPRHIEQPRALPGVSSKRWSAIRAIR